MHVLDRQIVELWPHFLANRHYPIAHRHATASGGIARAIVRRSGRLVHIACKAAIGPIRSCLSLSAAQTFAKYFGLTFSSVAKSFKLACGRAERGAILISPRREKVRRQIGRLTLDRIE